MMFQAQKIIDCCREYLIGLTMELKRKSLGKESIEDLKRSCEVSVTKLEWELNDFKFCMELIIIFRASDV